MTVRNGVLDPRNLYHTGIVVTNLNDSMHALTSSAGLRWRDILENTVNVQLEDQSKSVHFRCLYSREGPHFVELIEKIPGTIWDDESSGRLHHLGYWSDDVLADAAALSAAGWQQVAIHVPEQDVEPLFSFHEGSLGFYVELVTARRRSRLEGSSDYAGQTPHR
jgi:hypothetical protein